MNNPNPDFQARDIRDSQLSSFTQEKSLHALNKAKSLVMAYWHGETIATTKQVANFFGITTDSLQKVVSRHRDELNTDGLRKLEGKELQAAKDALSVAVKTTAATIWTPRAILRAGMLLEDNEVARQIRTVLLDQVERNPNPQQLGLFPEGDEPTPQPQCKAPDMTVIAQAIEIVLSQANVAPKIIAQATAEAIAQSHPGLDKVMSTAQKYLQ